MDPGDTEPPRTATLRDAATARALDALAAGEPLAQVLDGIARAVEAEAQGVRVAVLRRVGDAFELAAAPSLPAAFTRAVGRIVEGADALARGTGPVAGPLADAAAEHGLGFGWVWPVTVGAGGEVLGVVALFTGDKRFPTAAEKEVLAAAAPLAAVAMAFDGAREGAKRALQHDAMTGVLARDSFFAALPRIGDGSGDRLAVVLLHVPDVAVANARDGYRAGDAILRDVAARLRGAVRGRDLLARFGGATFVAACAVGAQDRALDGLVSRLRAAASGLGSSRVDPGPGSTVQVIVGVAVAVRPVPDPVALVARAEEALREARSEVSRPDRIRPSGAAPGDR